MLLLTAMTTIFDIKLFLLLSGFAVGILQGQPTITPSGEEHIIPANGNYTLTCRGNSPITWTYPHIKHTNETLTPDVVIVDLGNYTSSLQIRNADDLAVGYYFCNSTDGSYVSTYVYVNEDERLFVGREEIIVAIGKKDSDIIIPCRPTSPNVTVKLYEGIGTTDEIVSNVTQDGYPWTYNKREGITLSSLHQRTTIHLTCTFTKGNVLREATVIAIVTSM